MKILVASLIIVNLAATPGFCQPIAQQQMRTYRAPSFSIPYPSDWKVSNDGDHVVMKSPAGGELSVEYLPAALGTKEELMSDLLSQCRADPSICKILRQNTVAGRITTAATYEDAGRHSITIFIDDKPARSLLVTQVVDLNTAVAEQIVNGLVFSSVPSPQQSRNSTSTSNSAVQAYWASGFVSEIDETWDITDRFEITFTPESTYGSDGYLKVASYGTYKYEGSVSANAVSCRYTVNGKFQVAANVNSVRSSESGVAFIPRGMITLTPTTEPEGNFTGRCQEELRMAGRPPLDRATTAEISLQGNSLYIGGQKLNRHESTRILSGAGHIEWGKTVSSDVFVDSYRH